VTLSVLYSNELCLELNTVKFMSYPTINGSHYYYVQQSMNSIILIITSTFSFMWWLCQCMLLSIFFHSP